MHVLAHCASESDTGLEPAYWSLDYQRARFIMSNNSPTTHDGYGQRGGYDSQHVCDTLTGIIPHRRQTFSLLIFKISWNCTSRRVLRAAWLYIEWFDGGVTFRFHLLSMVFSLSFKGTGNLWYCQRPVFSLGVSQHMHKVTNLWKFSRPFGHRSCKRIMKEKAPLLHNFVCFQMSNKRVQLKSFII